MLVLGLRRPPLDDDLDVKAIGPTDSRTPQNLALLNALGSICSTTAQLPHTAIISDGLEKTGDIAVASGGFTDTWRGRYETKVVALKAFRTYPSQDLKEAKKVSPTNSVNVPSITSRASQILWKKIVVWKRLSHEHVLRFHGVDKRNFQLALVYDWADSGNIIQYLDSHPEVSRTPLVSSLTFHPG